MKLLWCKDGKHWAQLVMNPHKNGPPVFCSECDTAEYLLVVGKDSRRGKELLEFKERLKPRPENEVKGVMLELIRRDRTRKVYDADCLTFD